MNCTCSTAEATMLDADPCHWEKPVGVQCNIQRIFNTQPDRELKPGTFQSPSASRLTAAPYRLETEWHQLFCPNHENLRFLRFVRCVCLWTQSFVQCFHMKNVITDYMTHHFQHHPVGELWTLCLNMIQLYHSRNNVTSGSYFDTYSGQNVDRCATNPWVPSLSSVSGFPFPHSRATIGPSGTEIPESSEY